MNIKLPFLVDPKTKEPSVSLSLLILSFSALLLASTVHIAKLTDNTSSLLELFYATCGLYWGRRFQGKSGNILDSATQPEQKG